MVKSNEWSKFSWLYFFSKDNGINLTAIQGYYGEVEFQNNSQSKAELFSAACDVVESSK